MPVSQLASDNPFPSILLEDHVDPTAPTSGYHRLFVDTDEKLKMIDHASLVTDFTPGVAGDITTDPAWAAKGDLIAGTANNTAAILTAGADGLVLTADDGEATGLKWAAAAGGGALVLLEQHTAASSATLDFTTCISSSYDEYMIELIGIVPATNGAVMYLRFSTDGGANYDTSAIYDNHEIHYLWAGAGTSQGADGASYIPIFSDGAGTALLNTATPALQASLHLFDPLSATNYKYVMGRGVGVYTNTGRYWFDMRGVYRSATAVDAFRFLMSSGNIASGTIRVYGLANS